MIYGNYQQDYTERYEDKTIDNVFSLCEELLEEHSWGDCDDFCTHAFGELLRRYKSLFSKVKAWTKDEDFWVCRASAVILIPAILHKDYEGINPLMISDF